MKQLLSRSLGFKLALGYLSIYVLLTLYALLVAHRTPFGGLPLMIITLPWSLGLGFVLMLTGYIAWYGQFAQDNPFAYIFFASLGLLPGALINAHILYHLPSFFKSLFKKNSQDKQDVV